MKATLLLHNGPIYDGAVSKPHSYLALDGVKVLATGKGSGKQFIGRQTRVIDLKGKAVTPGIIDAHIHLLDYAWGLERVNLGNCSDEQSVKAKLLERKATAASDEWILGRSWNREQFGGFPHRSLLDEIFPDNPVALNSQDGHFLWVNSKALELAGLTRQVFVSGGFVGTGPDGSLSGILGENAVQLITPAIPKPHAGSRKKSLLTAQKKLNSLGIVGIHNVDGNQAFGDLQELRAESKLSIRIFHSIPLDQLDHAVSVSLKSGLGDSLFRFGFIKIFSDGTLGSQSAWMLEPFDGTSTTGIETISEQDLTLKIGLALQNGIAVGIHAIGDRANRQALNAFEKNRELMNVPCAKSRIEHAQLLHRDDISRFANLGVIASMQPHHAISDYELVKQYWNSRQDFAYPWKSLLKSGAVLIFGSDAPIENPDPLQALRAAVHRQNWGNQNQVVGAFEALQAHTKYPAMASGEGEIKGTLEPGKFADFAIFSEDPVASGFQDAVVLGTVLGGEFVHHDFEEN